MTILNLDTLINIGFRDVAKWVSTDNGNGIKYEFHDPNATADQALFDVRKALYAFVQDESVNYIGKTAQSIKKRFVGYRTPGSGKQTNWRCHNNIKELLRKNITVKILAFRSPPHFRYGEFEIDLAAGLEEELILRFKPSWNGRDGKRPITEGAEREEKEIEDAEREAKEAAEVALAREANSGEISSTLPDARTDISAARRSQQQTTFPIELGTAYYDQGFINPGVDASKHLGQHGDPVIVLLGNESEQVDSFINRRANQNQTVRVVGNNRRIAEWFQRNFQRGDVVEAKVQGPHRILLLPRASVK